MRYTYKDKLKEAQYIIEGHYNTLLTPQQYKYLLDDSKAFGLDRNRARVSEGNELQYN